MDFLTVLVHAQIVYVQHSVALVMHVKVYFNQNEFSVIYINLHDLSIK
jgi:hypothetical protein